MSSILTNTSAMVALQTLRGINSNLSKAQDEISTGKSIATARDNSAVWAISKVMESDVKGFKAISDSLSLGQSTITVARSAAETVTDLLTDIKGKIVAAQEANVDRSKIQTDITALRDQIASVVDAAQFNGLNLLKDSGAVDILSSLDRSSTGVVTARNISIDRQNLSQNAAALGTGADLTAGSVSASSITNARTLDITITAANSTAYTVTLNGNNYSFTSDADATTAEIADGLLAAIGTAETGVTATNESGTLRIANANDTTAVSVTVGANLAAAGGATSIAGRAENVAFDNSVAISENDSFQVTLGTAAFTYVAGAGDTYEDVVTGLAAQINAGGLTGVTATTGQNGGNWQVSIANSGASAVSLALAQKADGTAGGGLEALSSINVSTDEGADAALASIEGLIQRAIDASAEFGSAQGRIDIQTDFVGKLTDSLRAGISTLVDADMEEASARLQALQVQQQLGIQSLSIANQQPQSILALFR